jgi:hypothetical protein
MTTTKTRSTNPSRRGAAVLCALLTLSLLATPAQAAKPNFGLYVENYVMMVPSNADFLIHPTGEYLTFSDKKSWKRSKAAYTPVYRDTDDMDAVVADMRDNGYVMIGYSAFSTSEAGESYQDQMKTMSSAEQAGYVLGLKMRGIDPWASPLGDPIDAARWANAEQVFVQKGYAFSRMEIQKERIVTDEGRDTTTIAGRTRSGYMDDHVSATQGASTTRGSSRTNGQTKDTSWNVGGELGIGVAGVNGNYGQAKGTHASQTQYNENTSYGEATVATSSGDSYVDTNETVRHDTKHWATALIDRHVDHYDYMVTFWKRADVDKVVLGTLTEPVRRDMWASLGTRHAREVSAVIGGSPAFMADIWEGDILLAIDGERIAGEQGFNRLLDAHAGREVTVTVWRDGEIYDVPIPLTPTN